MTIAIPTIIGFLLLPLYTSYLTPYDYGIKAVIILSILVFEIFSDLGLNWVIRAKFFTIKNDKELASYISTLLFLSLLLRLLMTFFLSFSNDLIFPQLINNWTSFHSELLKIQMIIFFLSFSRNTLTPIFILEKKLSKYLVLILLPFFLQVFISIFFLVKRNLGLKSLFYGELVGTLFNVLLSMFFLRKYFTYKFNYNALMDVKIIGLPTFPKNVFGQIQANLNKYFIMIYMTTYDLGIFQKSDFLSGGFKSLQKVVGNTIAPNNLKKITENKEDFESGKIIIKFLYAISLMIIFFSFFLEDIFKIMKVNQSFLVCANYAPLYGCNILITSFVIMFNHNILVSKKTKFFAYSSLFALCTSVISNFILVPIYGIIGGIISIILVSFTTTVASIIFSEFSLNYQTRINFKVWIFLILSVFSLITLNLNNYFGTVLFKTLVLISYGLFILAIDKFFISTINWNIISKKLK